MTLTYKFDLGILPLKLQAKIQVHMPVHSAGIARWKDTHTYIDDVKIITPVRSEKWGVVIRFQLINELVVLKSLLICKSIRFIQYNLTHAAP